MFYGALEPKADVRDYKIAAAGAEFPKSWQVEFLPEVKHQKAVGSCVAHATSSILEYFNQQETGKYKMLSTDFIYGMQGVKLNRAKPGMYLRDACKIVKEYGDCLKETIDTNTEQPKCTDMLNEILTEEIYSEAKMYHVQSYASCKTEKEIKHALMNYGPALASMRWYDKNKVNGEIIEMDKTSDYGNHAVMIYGWNEKGWLCQNSWGKGWNNDGRFVVPYEDKFNEVWSFVDASNNDIKKPKRNYLLDIGYHIINIIINMIKKIMATLK